MGNFKGIVNVYSDELRKLQIEEREEAKREMFEVLNEIKKQNATDELSKKDKMSFAMIKNQVGRQNFRNEILKLNLTHLQLLSQLMETEKEDMLKNQLMVKAHCFVNLYVLTGYHLASKDIGSESDPYMIVSLGGVVHNFRDEYQTNEPNPRIYKKIQFSGEFPGSSSLEIKFMDMDEIFGDDAIGSTVIDIEDRFYSHQWQSIMNKPIETRKLTHPSTASGQGYVRCWVDIVPTHLESTYTEYSIQPKPEEELEVRVVVFKGKEVESKDAEGCSDVFFKGYFDEKHPKQTDTHYRCFDGNCEFNYRLKFPYKVSDDRTKTFTLKCYDRDLLKSNDFIGEVQFDLTEVINDTCITK